MDVNFVQGEKSNLYTKIVQGIVYAAFVLVPLFYLPFTSGILEYNKQLLLIITAAVGLVAWLLGVVVTGTLRIRFTPIDKGIFGILIATTVAALFSLTRMHSIFGAANNLSSSLVTA